MTLDEAIKHAEEVAVRKDKEAYNWEYNYDMNVFETVAECKKCAAEHRQLAEWLKELKQLREHTRCIHVDERLPKENGWYQCTVVINDLPRTIELFYKNGKWLDNRRIDMFNIYDIYGYGGTNEKHKLSYQELISEFDWTENVIAWMPLPKPYNVKV